MGGPTNSEDMEFIIPTRCTHVHKLMLTTWLACLKTYIEIGVCENLGGGNRCDTGLFGGIVCQCYSRNLCNSKKDVINSCKNLQFCFCILQNSI